MTGGHRNDAYPNRRKVVSGCAAVMPTGMCRTGTARLPAEAARPFVSIHRESGGSRSKDLGGDIEAHGRTGHRRLETAHDGTDPFTEQGLEVDAHSAGRIERRER